MAKLGAYRDRIEILPRVLAAPDATGEEVETWPDPSPTQGHWAAIESPTGSDGAEAPRGSGGGLTLRFRHQVAIAAVDRVRVKETGDVYAVTGIWRDRAEDGGWQTVCSLALPDY